MTARAVNWYLQRITGAALLVLLVMHFWVEHFSAEARTPIGLTFEIIQRRFFNNPWFVAVDLSFLFIALYHGLNGVRNILLDYTWGVRLKKPITTVLLLLGIVVAYWGVTAFVGNPHLKEMTNSRMTNDEENPNSSIIRHSSFVIPSFSPEASVVAA